MARTCLDHAEPADMLDFQERLSAMSPRDRLIAECIMAGMTQAETGRVVGLAQQRVSERVAAMARLFDFFR